MLCQISHRHHQPPLATKTYDTLPYPHSTIVTFCTSHILYYSQDNQNDHNPGTPGEGDNQFSNLLPFSQDNVSDMLFLNLC